MAQTAKTRGSARSSAEGKPVRRTAAQVKRIIQYNPNPIFQIERSGRLVYYNLAGKVLVDALGARLGDPAPEVWSLSAQAALASGEVRHFEQRVAGLHFAFTVIPETEGECATLYVAEIPAAQSPQTAVSTSTGDPDSIEAHAAFLNRLAGGLASVETPEQVVKLTVAQIGAYLQVDRCSIDEIDLEKDIAYVYPGYHPDLEPVKDEYPLAVMPPKLLDELRRGRQVVVDHVSTDPRTRDDPTLEHLPLFAGALVSTPGMRDDEWIGTLNVTAGRPRAWRAAELALLRSASDLVWLSIERTRLLSGNRRQRELLERLVNEIPAGVAFLQGPEHRFTLVNPAYETITAGKGALIGRPFADVWRVAGKIWVPILDDVYRTGKSARIDDAHVIVYYEGGQRDAYFDLTFTPFLDEDGEIDGVAVVQHETTSQVQARQETEAERARLQALIESAPEGIVLTDARGSMILANPAAERLLGRPAPIGRPYSDHAALQLFYPDGEPYEPRNLPLTRAVLDGQSFHDLDMQVRLPDGLLRPLLVNAAPVRNSQGELIGAVGLFQDIQERKTAEDLLVDYALRLERSNRDLQDFAFIASHDLQEPLRKVVSFCDLLKQNYEDALGETGGDYIARMHSAARRMQGMIDSLLEYSRLTARKQPFKLENLTAIAQEALLDLEARVTETGGSVEIGDLPEIEADRQQMLQLFQNLIGNALKFHRRGVPPQVTVEASRVAGGQVVIDIRDNGIGIPMQFAERIFDPFQRLHGRSAYEGSGIGLSICRRIVELHRGKISVESESDCCSIFRVTLPLRQNSV